MISYLEILAKCLNQGQRKENRTGVDTFVVPPQGWSHDMSTGFPLVTTKRIPTKTMLTELQGFIGGITNKQWYKYRGCNIWNQWSNGYTRPEDISAEDWEDLGPIYGYQWRRFGHDHGKPVNAPLPVTHGYNRDQLSTIVDTLKTNPNDRRMVCSAWNPVQHDEMALPPCHVLWNVQHIKGTLHLHWHQRSCDMFLGVPFNIASYAMLLVLLCKETGMKPGQLSCTLMDCHIYENHLEQITEQLSRPCLNLPQVAFNRWDGIFNWRAEDTTFPGYNPWKKIKAEVAI